MDVSYPTNSQPISYLDGRHSTGALQIHGPPGVQFIVSDCTAAAILPVWVRVAIHG